MCVFHSNIYETAVIVLSDAVMVFWFYYFFHDMFL